MTTHALQHAPVWYQEFRRLFLAGVSHCFVVTGDIHGLTAQGGTQQGFLHRNLASREVVAWYHPATGITFPLPSMKAKALEWLGSNWQQAVPSDDPYTAALDAAGMTSAPDDPFAAARKPAKALALLDLLLHSPHAVSITQTAQGEEIRGLLAVVIDQADLMMPATPKAQMSEERLGVLATLLSWGHAATHGLS